jgi:Lrp/AsnC family transcriptional regulator, leucine-responsive regulatory protein
MPLRELDAIDRRILCELQNEAKISNVELANRVGLSPSPCLARVRALERDGVIARYVALVEPERLGLPISVFIQVTLEKQIDQALARFERQMEAMQEVMECYLMTGDSDYLVRVVVPDVSELQRFITEKLSTIEGVATIRSSFALKQVKYKTAIPLEA